MQAVTDMAAVCTQHRVTLPSTVEQAAASAINQACSPHASRPPCTHLAGT